MGLSVHLPSWCLEQLVVLVGRPVRLNQFHIPDIVSTTVSVGQLTLGGIDDSMFV